MGDSIVVTINVDEMLNGQDIGTTLPQLVIAKAADLVVSRMMLDADNYRPLRDRVHEIMEGEVRKAVVPAIEQALAAPVQRHSEFGEPVGDPVTLNEYIANVARRMLQQGGRPVEQRRGGSVVEQVIEESVRRVLASELQKEVDAAKAQVREAVRQKGADFLADTVTKLSR